MSISSLDGLFCRQNITISEIVLLHGFFFFFLNHCWVFIVIIVMLGPLSLTGLQRQFVTSSDTDHLHLHSQETISWNPVAKAHARKDRDFLYWGLFCSEEGTEAALRCSEFF